MNVVHGVLSTHPQVNGNIDPVRVVVEFDRGNPIVSTVSNSVYNGFFPPGNYRRVEIYIDVNSGPSPNSNPNNCGLRTSDIVVLSNILRGSHDPSAAQLVAADVNIDGAVNITDIAMMRAVILGRLNSFQNTLNVGGLSYSNLSAVMPTTRSLSTSDFNIGDVKYSYRYVGESASEGLIGQNFTLINLGDLNYSCPNFN